MKKYAASVGNLALYSFDVTHNLGTRDVIVQAHNSKDPYEVVDVDMYIKDENTVTISVGAVVGVPPIDVNALRVVVIG
jgi:hypothetical protein